MSEAAKVQESQDKAVVVLQKINHGKATYNDLDLFIEEAEAIRRKVHLLMPINRLQNLPIPWSIELRPLDISRDPANENDWYEESKDSFCLHHHALMKLSQARDIEWIDQRRLDDRRDPYFWEVWVKGRYRGYNGFLKIESDAAQLDLRDGAPRALEARSAADLQRRRRNGFEVCTSRAKNRVIRKILGLRSYSKVEVQSIPFVVPALIFDPERIPDPAVRAQVYLEQAREARGAVDTLFGPTAQPEALPAPADEPPAPTEPKGERQEPGTAKGSVPGDDVPFGLVIAVSGAAAAIGSLLV